MQFILNFKKAKQKTRERKRELIWIIERRKMI